MSPLYPQGRGKECSAMGFELKHYNQKEVREIYSENTIEDFADFPLKNVKKDAVRAGIDSLNREPPEVPGARVPVVQREEDSADEDIRRNQDEVGCEARRPDEGEENLAAEGRERASRFAASWSSCGSMIASSQAACRQRPRGRW